MTDFKGDHFSKVDAKGRVLFPFRLKKQLPDESGHALVGQLDTEEKSLQLYTISEWNSIVEKTMKRLNPHNPKHKLFRRDFFRDVLEMEFDSAGRILIPKRFLDALSIEPGKGAEVVLAGQGPAIELMSKELYESSRLSPEESASLRDDVMGDSIWFENRE